MGTKDKSNEACFIKLMPSASWLVHILMMKDLIWFNGTLDILQLSPCHMMFCRTIFTDCFRMLPFLFKGHVMWYRQEIVTFVYFVNFYILLTAIVINTNSQNFLKNNNICIFFPAGIDYAGISRNLDFAPGVTMQNVRVYIMDDLGQPLREGAETFELVLRMPMNAVLGAPSLSVVTINDTVSDCKLGFIKITCRPFPNSFTI